MLLTDGKYYDNTVHKLELEHFNLTLTVYTSDTTLPIHHHENPYLSLLLEGNYIEKGSKEDTIIAGGHSIFRPDANPLSKQQTTYSLFRLLTGSATAAFTAWKLTVANAIVATSKAAVANIHQLSVIRYG